MWWQTVALAAALSALGWILRRHFADDRAMAAKVDSLASDVAFIRGVLSVTFPTATRRVESETEEKS